MDPLLETRDLDAAASKGGAETRVGAKSRRSGKPLGARARAFEANSMHRRTGRVRALSRSRFDESMPADEADELRQRWRSMRAQWGRVQLVQARTSQS